jgi:hypothetical protein
MFMQYAGYIAGYGACGGDMTAHAGYPERENGK